MPKVQKNPNTTRDQSFRTSKNEFSDSGKYRRRGPKNRFAKTLSVGQEVERIIELQRSDVKTSDIAQIMQMSVATVYRRLNSGGMSLKHSPEEAGALKKRAIVFLARCRLDLERALERAERRSERALKVPCCELCASFALELEAFRLAANLHKAEGQYLTRMGVFHEIRHSGQALEFVRYAGRLMASERASGHRPEAADKH